MVTIANHREIMSKAIVIVNGRNKADLSHNPLEQVSLVSMRAVGNRTPVGREAPVTKAVPEERPHLSSLNPARSSLGTYTMLLGRVQLGCPQPFT